MERQEVTVGDYNILKGYEEDPGMEDPIFKIEEDLKLIHISEPIRT